MHTVFPKNLSRVLHKDFRGGDAKIIRLVGGEPLFAKKILALIK